MNRCRNMFRNWQCATSTQKSIGETFNMILHYWPCRFMCVPQLERQRYCFQLSPLLKSWDYAKSPNSKKVCVEPRVPIICRLVRPNGPPNCRPKYLCSPPNWPAQILSPSRPNRPPKFVVPQRRPKSMCFHDILAPPKFRSAKKHVFS